MTFKEAKLKRDNNPTHVRDGEVYQTLVAPKLYKDYLKFIALNKKSPLSDEEVKELSSDGTFQLVGVQRGDNIYVINI